MTIGSVAVSNFCLRGKAWVLKVQRHKHVLDWTAISTVCKCNWMHAAKSNIMWYRYETRKVYDHVAWRVLVIWLALILLSLCWCSQCLQKWGRGEKQDTANESQWWQQMIGESFIVRTDRWLFSIMLFLCRSTSTIELMNNYSYNYSYIIIPYYYTAGIFQGYNVRGFH